MVSEPRLWKESLLGSPHTVGDKAGRVRGMFNAIAPRYEMVNSLFSGGRDAYWRRRAVQLARVRPIDEVLDVACGTGNFARVFARAGPRTVIGCDFAHEMLVRAVAEGQVDDDHCSQSSGTRGWIEGDGLCLPFGDGSFSVVSCAFGVRNFGDLERGLREMHRVLGPGGRAVILEFTRPANRLFRALYELYTHRLMPIAATWISGDKSGAYRYLPRSVVSFHTPEQMEATLRAIGFDDVSTTPLTFGAVAVYVARRA